MATDTLNFATITEASFEPVTEEMRPKIARVRNCIVLLGHLFTQISPETIQSLYDASIRMGLRPSEVNHSENAVPILKEALSH